MSYEQPTPEKLQLVANIRKDWLSNRYSARQLSKKYGFRVDSIIYNKSYVDPDYKPRPKPSTRPRG